jgi:hypothetical protein
MMEKTCKLNEHLGQELSLLNHHYFHLRTNSFRARCSKYSCSSSSHHHQHWLFQGLHIIALFFYCFEAKATAETPLLSVEQIGLSMPQGKEGHILLNIDSQTPTLTDKGYQ